MNWKTEMRESVPRSQIFSYYPCCTVIGEMKNKICHCLNQELSAWWLSCVGHLPALRFKTVSNYFKFPWRKRSKLGTLTEKQKLMGAQLFKKYRKYCNNCLEFLSPIIAPLLTPVKEIFRRKKPSSQKSGNWKIAVDKYSDSTQASLLHPPTLDSSFSRKYIFIYVLFANDLFNLNNKGKV